MCKEKVENELKKWLKITGIVLIVFIVILFIALFISWQIWKGGLKVERFSHEFMAKQLFSYPYVKALVKEGAIFCV